MKNTVEFQKAYIRDEKVQELRDVAGVTNFSEFVRQCVDERIKEARGIAAKQTPGTTTLQEATKCQSVT
jgi:hypothetical protein